MTEPYPVGCTYVTVTVSDNCANSYVAQTQVCVIDDEAPIFVTCPDNIFSCDGTATWDLPEVSDNCAAMITDVSPPSGSTFPLGENEVVITAMDAQGNTATCSFMVFYDPLLLQIIASDYNGYGTRCRGGSDGWLEADVTGGYGDYGYEWNTGESTPSIINLPSGSYSVMITDSRGCQTEGSIFVTEPNDLLVEAEVRDVLCAEGTSTDIGDDGGQISLTPIGGAGNYTYTWASTDPDFVDPGTQEITGLAPGTYTYLVIDSNECQASGQETVNEPSPITASAVNIGQNNTEGTSGNILPVYYNSHIIEVSGGSGDYTYDWNRSGYVRWEIDNEFGVPGETLTVIYADDAEWSVTIYDANGCTGDDLVYTNDSGNPEGNPPVANGGSILDIDEVIIQGESYGDENSGWIDILVVGGVPPYTYTWSGPGTYSQGPGINLDYIDGLGYGFYEVTVTDSGDPQQTTEGFYWVPRDRRTGRLKTSTKLDKDGDLLLATASPNPFCESTQLSAWTAQAGELTVKLIDAQGKLVSIVAQREVKENEMTFIDLNASQLGLSPGLYVLAFEQEQASSFVKLVLTE